MRNFWNWLVTSSADPSKTSLAIKGTIVLGGSQIVRVVETACSFGLYCLGIDNSLVNHFAESVEAIVYGLLLAWGGVWAIYGLGRKIYNARWSHPDVIE